MFFSVRCAYSTRDCICRAAFPALPSAPVSRARSIRARRALRSIPKLQVAIGLNPLFADAFYNRGNTHKVKGELKLAILDYDKALELDPYLALAHANQGLTLLLRGRDAEAEKDFVHCVRLAPGFGRALEQLIVHTRAKR